MEHGGHMAHAKMMKKRFFVCLVLSVPILLFSQMMGIELPFHISFPGSEWVVLVFATILYFYGGMPFLSGAKAELKDKRPAMMTLISLGISVAYFYSLYAFAVNNFAGGPKGHTMDFFWELATLIDIMLLGHWIEMKAVGSAGSALQQMAALLPGSADVVEDDGNIRETPLQDVKVGQKVLVKAGEKVPADGVVVKGQTTVNESMVTGEARAVSKKEDDKVIGGSVNGAGTITIRVTGTGESGYLAQVMQLVGSAQKEKSRAESLSDRVAGWLFYAAAGAGVAALIVWLLATAQPETALERMVTVLVIACPHALGLAIPLVAARSTSIGARNGLLIRDRKAFETAKTADILMMDKTGTLTEGDFSVSAVKSFDPRYSESDVLSLMGALEQNSSHPLAEGILKEAKKRGLSLPAAADVKNIAGVGLSGTVEGKDVKIVTAAYLDGKEKDYDKKVFAGLAEKGNSVSFLMEGDVVAGLVAQGDRIKPNAKKMIDGLKARNIRPVMLTGDNEAAAKTVAAQLGIGDVHAGLLPEDKEKIVRQYKEQGHTVLMVGDGVNDAPALARAGVGIAIGAGTDVAIDSAEVILVRSDPADILHFLSLAENTNRKMVENLWWGAGYNIVAIPLAAGVLAPVGILLSPAVGAALMSLSTVIVAVNALTLRIGKRGA